MQAKLAKLGLSANSPIMMRFFKEEEVLEVWKAKASDRYVLVATYPICAWSGMLGPKKKEGDRQAPEGFYEIAPGQMNPNSDYYLSFNIGYPNKFDRAYGRGGANIMVHGACSSAGCYSMSDAAVLQIYAFARDAFRGGQKSFQVEAFPFRMTAENMAKHRFSEYYDFWKNIKVGYDYFELTHRPPEVDVCEKKYVFNQVAPDGTHFNASGKCPATSTPPALVSAYSSYEKTYETAFAEATKHWSEGSWVDTPEFDRKAKERAAKRAGHDRKVPNDAEYVLVDPSAKITPTSDTVTSYSAAFAKIEAKRAGIPDKVEYISVAEFKARQKAAEDLKKTEEKLAKQLAKAKVPVPQPNPLKVTVEATETNAQPAQQEGKPFWKFW
jgi:murein L,D-transpeptidase YafK